MPTAQEQNDGFVTQEDRPGADSALSNSPTSQAKLGNQMGGLDARVVAAQVRQAALKAQKTIGGTKIGQETRHQMDAEGEKLVQDALTDLGKIPVAIPPPDEEEALLLGQIRFKFNKDRDWKGAVAHFLNQSGFPSIRLLPLEVSTSINDQITDMISNVENPFILLTHRWITSHRAVAQHMPQFYITLLKLAAYRSVTTLILAQSGTPSDAEK